MKQQIITDHFRFNGVMCPRMMQEVAENIEEMNGASSYGAMLSRSDGGETIKVAGLSSFEEAEALVVELAIKSGWKPPKRWQFWKNQWPKWAVDEYKRQSKS